MLRNPHTRNLLGACLALSLCLAPAALAAPEMGGIKAGFDVWQTLGSGATAYSFADDPLPADFFCPGSEVFKGRLELEGRPVKTEPAGALGSTDTVIQRLDDAVFNKQGVARTRIKIQGLNLEASEPVRTNCGTWRAEVGLDKTQPVSEMSFHKEYANGGTIHADLWINARITFTNERTGAERVATRLLNLPTANQTAFACGPDAVRLCPALANSAVINSSVSNGALSKLTVISQPIGDGLIVGGGQIGIAEPYLYENCAVGCACNPENPSQCLPVYSWHYNCFNPMPRPGSAQWYICESHWTTPPCGVPQYAQLLPQCQDHAPSRAGQLEALQEMEEMGIINEPAETVLEKMRGGAKR